MLLRSSILRLAPNSSKFNGFVLGKSTGRHGCWPSSFLGFKSARAMFRSRSHEGHPCQPSNWRSSQRLPVSWRSWDSSGIQWENGWEHPQGCSMATTYHGTRSCFDSNKSQCLTSKSGGLAAIWSLGFKWVSVAAFPTNQESFSHRVSGRVGLSNVFFSMVSTLA